MTFPCSPPYWEFYRGSVLDFTECPFCVYGYSHVVFVFFFGLFMWWITLTEFWNSFACLGEVPLGPGVWLLLYTVGLDLLLFWWGFSNQCSWEVLVCGFLIMSLILIWGWGCLIERVTNYSFCFCSLQEIGEKWCNFFFKCWVESPLNASGPSAFSFGRLFIIDSISIIAIGLFRVPLFSHVSSGRLCLSRNCISFKYYQICGHA